LIKGIVQPKNFSSSQNYVMIMDIKDWLTF
jgi:hypothetical protein